MTLKVCETARGQSLTRQGGWSARRIVRRISALVFRAMVQMGKVRF